MVRNIRFIAVAAILAAAIQVPGRIQAAQGGLQDPTQAPAAAADVAAGTNSLYIVQMADFPVASYTGGIQGFAATKPNRGQKINPSDANVIAYARYLDGRHDDALTRAGGGRKVYDYHYSFNGFTAELTEAQAAALNRAEGVVAVTKDELVNADTSSTPRFLGLDAPDGLWDHLGGADRAGEDVVIGIIDSGIWPESLSFSDRTGTNGNATKDGKLSYHQIPGWHGKCTPGEAFTAAMCNQKLIGAQHFNAAWGGDEGIEAERPWEFASVRDYNGHGTHTASTAGGNRGVVATGPAAIFGRINGIAPRARIAAYKALWSTQDAAMASGRLADLVAAIDQAVADGVDVINYSIAGTNTNFLDPVEIAFLFAADAGVFVSASAGNSGPFSSTVAHPSPWITTVAAGTHDRDGAGATTLGNGETLLGASVATTGVGPAPLIDASVAGFDGADPEMARLCFTPGDSAANDGDGKPVLDPAKVAGKIVVCDRGISARINKSLAVKQAGGVGMILVNTSASSINADFHFVPTVHLAHTALLVLESYRGGASPTATIHPAALVKTAAPFTASFSSRGPLQAGGGDLLKPDVIAPGQDIIAAVAPPGNHQLSFNVYSGTSMSAPHVAGLAALLKDAHEDWTPMMIKSALMTTATDVLDGGVPAPNTNPVLIFRQGAGHVAPNTAVDPGLVYDSGVFEWLAFLCGTTTGVNPATCNALASAGYSLDPSDVNVPSIAIGDLMVTQTVGRTVTNVGDARATYNATMSGMVGFDVIITPSTLQLRPGERKSFQVTFTRKAGPDSATLGAYAGGQLTWSDGAGGHSVRTPVVIRPLPLSAPAEVSSTGSPIQYNVRFGYTGAFTAAPRGLVPAAVTAGEVGDDPADSFSPTGQGVVAIPVTILANPANPTSYARFSLFDADVVPPGDIDMYVFRGSTLVGISAGATSREEVNLLNPVAGDYTVYLHGFEVSGTATFKLFSWLLDSTAGGNMIVTAPPSATAGASGTIELTFTGLVSGTKYLGSVVYGGASGMPSPTIVRVDP